MQFSQQSGIGDGAPKRTAFKLYRTPKGSKRAIYPGDEAALERALRLAPATDYPIVIANDDFYGGLGGRYAISTSSVRSGLTVLRHELGHNFGEVGEEYDNGYVYSGANASRSPNASWSHWSESRLETFEAKILSGNYVWKELSEGAYEKSFQFPANLSSMILQLSTVGWDTPEDVAVTLNDTLVDLHGNYHEDRSFLTSPIMPLSGAQTFRLKVQEKIADSNNILGFAVARGYPKDYDFTPNKIAAFATFDANGRKSYRPTHDSCLMREIELEHFCSVDIENMWHKFLNRVRLIDDLRAEEINSGYKVQLLAPALPELQIKWFNGNTEIESLRNMREWSTAQASDLSNIVVRVDFKTEEVRKYSSRFSDQRQLQRPKTSQNQKKRIRE